MTLPSMKALIFEIFCLGGSWGFEKDLEEFRWESVLGVCLPNLGGSLLRFISEMLNSWMSSVEL